MEGDARKWVRIDPSSIDSADDPAAYPPGFTRVLDADAVRTTTRAASSYSQTPVAQPSIYPYGNESQDQLSAEGLSVTGGLAYPYSYTQNVAPNQSVQYGSYAQSLMYASQTPQAYNSTMYVAVPPQQARQYTAQQGSPSQFSVSPSYYAQRAEGSISSSAANLSMAQQSQEHLMRQYYQPQLEANYPAPATYQSTMDDNPNFSQATPSSTGGGAVRVSRDDAFAAYSVQLKQSVELRQQGQLGQAAKSLLELSTWFLHNVEALGLTFDDTARRESRLKLWQDFNRCWLDLLVAQKDMSQGELNSDNRSTSPQRRISREFLKTIGDRIVELCNDLEEWGLVDYQEGVWEDEIIEVLNICWDIALELDPPSEEEEEEQPEQFTTPRQKRPRQEDQTQSKSAPSSKRRR